MKTLMIQPLLWASPILLLLLILEIIYSKSKGHKNTYKLRDFLASISMGIGALIINQLPKFLYYTVLFYLVYKNFNIEKNGIITNIFGYVSFGWQWYNWFVCLVLCDLSHYWGHRFNHTVRFMWAAHIVHHSSEHYNYGTAIRLSWVSTFYKPLYYLWLLMLGFHPEMVIVCKSIGVVWQFVLHTTYCPKLGFLENIVMTPKQHQIHHATNTELLDKNHGAIFNIFDRIFGTWKSYKSAENINYGVTTPPNSYNPFQIVTHEYMAIWSDLKTSKTIKEAFMYIFGPPGWKPLGFGYTVKQLQNLNKLENKQKTRYTLKRIYQKIVKKRVMQTVKMLPEITEKQGF